MMYYICKVAQYCNRINEFPRECVTGLATRNFLILLARSLKSSNAKSFLLTHLDIAPAGSRALSSKIKHDGRESKFNSLLAEETSFVSIE